MDKIPEIDKIAKSLLDALPASVRDLQKDVEENFKSALATGLSKMNLVTREEFDTQTALLERTREKLENMEKLLSELEKSNSS